MARPADGPTEPQLATLVAEAPAGDEWLHEMKLDGYRLLAHVHKQQVKLLTRHGNDWAERVPSIVAALLGLGIDDAVFDGELVVLDDAGVSDFQSLQNSLAAGKDGALVYFVFDLLRLHGRSLAELPLEERKRELATVVPKQKKKNVKIRLSDHVVGQGPAFFAQACRMNLEGIVSKRRDRPYRPGRSADWLKVKCKRRQEFVIGGFSAPRASRSHFGALLLGLYDEAGKLRYAGKVGTGFTSASLREIHERLLPLVQAKPAFANPPRGAEARDLTWTAPRLLAEIEFAEITRDGRVRHASFQGLRDDKPAHMARLERPAPL